MREILNPAPFRLSLEEMIPRIKVLERYNPKFVRELRDIQAEAREFADRYIRPIALDIDEKVEHDPKYFNWDIVKKSFDHHYLSFFIPKAVGGQGFLISHFCILMEELSSACAGVANIFGAHALGLSGILLGMDIDHYDRSLAEVAREEKRGHPVLFSAAVTEPMAGSDLEDKDCLPMARICTFAQKVKGGYRLNGRKVFISNGSVAKYHVVLAALDRHRILESWSGFLVPSESKGFSVGRVEEKMGQRACPAAELIFEDVFVPQEDLIGNEGEGMWATSLVLGASRGPVGAIATGIARGAYERSLAYAVNKKVGGRRLIDQQWVQMALADMATEIQSARQLYFDAAMEFDLFGIPKMMRHPISKLALSFTPSRLRTSKLGKRYYRSEKTKKFIRKVMEKTVPEKDISRIAGYSSMAKVCASDMAVRVCSKALEIMGPDGVKRCFGVEKCFRDARLTQIYEGTNEINRINIFKNMIRKSDNL